MSTFLRRTGEGELIVCTRPMRGARSRVCACAMRSANACREAQFMAVRIADVKVAFAPRCIGRRTIRREVLRERVTIESIDVVDVENYPAPPRPCLLGDSRHQIQV